jgi:hypothetical protein
MHSLSVEGREKHLPSGSGRPSSGFCCCHLLAVYAGSFVSLSPGFLGHTGIYLMSSHGALMKSVFLLVGEVTAEDSIVSLLVALKIKAIISGLPLPLFEIQSVFRIRGGLVCTDTKILDTRAPCVKWHSICVKPTHIFIYLISSLFTYDN